MALTEAQKAILAGARSRQQREAEARAGVEKMPVRSFMQGATFGFSDEIEAAVRSIVPSSRSYDEIRDELRAKLAAYKEAYPAQSISSEIAGAILPTVVASFTPAAPLVAGSTLPRVAAIGAIEGGLYGAGTSEAEDAYGIAKDIAAGTAFGGVAAHVPGVAMKMLKIPASKAFSFLREKVGDKATSAAEKKLYEMANQTGKSIDEIIMDIAEGRTLSDNETLNMAIKVMAQEGDEAGRYIRESAAQRAKETTVEAMSSLRGKLAPDYDENVVRGYKMEEAALKKAEQKSYEAALGDNLAQSEVADQLLEVLKRMPEVRKALESVYTKGGKLAPLFKVADDGSIELVRQPTLKDAELAMRITRDKATSLYQKGQGTLGEVYKNVSSGLKETLNTASPALETARSQAAIFRTAKDAFEAGRKALSSNVDELELAMERMAGQDESILKAFRAGVLDSIRNKSRKTGTTIANLANEDSQLGAVLRTVLPEGSEDVIKKLDIAGNARRLAKNVPETAGSQTQPMQRAAVKFGGGSALSDITGAMQGSMSSIKNLVSRLINMKAPNLTEAERMQIAQILFSQNPDLVERALTDRTALAELGQAANALTDRLISGTQAAAAQQSQNIVGEYYGNG